jgi:hypothetical protein
VNDSTRYVAFSVLLKRRGHKPFLSRQDEVALAASVVHQAQFGLAIKKDQLAAEACKMALRTRPHHALTGQSVAEGRAGPKWVKKFYERLDWLISERNGDPQDHHRAAAVSGCDMANGQQCV